MNKLETKHNNNNDDIVKRKMFEQLMLDEFFYAPAFEIHGGVSGLYDYGPNGCAVFNNLLALSF
jgi:glycyl-tRNA synthetase